MGKRQVIVTRVKIGESGQVKYFQVRLPQNTRSIIGVEASSPWKPLPKASVFLRSFEYSRSIVMGELKLQACGKANVFYAKQVMSDENMHTGDFSQTNKWHTNVFSHQLRMEEDEVEVDGDSTVVLGMFQDRYGELNGTDAEYVVSVCIWIELHELIEEKGAAT